MTSNATSEAAAPAPGPPDLTQALLRAGLRAEQVRTRAIDRLAYAHDASHYLLTPQAVVLPHSAADVGLLFRVGAELGLPLTFRSGGTSLSGQAVSDGLLVDTRRHFRGVEVLDDGARVRVRPGTTVRAVNAALAPYGRKLGPDPASEAACTLGGVIANNSSGMACGTEQNTYRTLESLVLVLPSGSVVDTGARDADVTLRALEPELHAGLLRLRDRVRSDADSVRRIRQQFAMKNTMGYGLNAFLDHDEPAQLLAHLVVGSEGTLAFVAEATLRTVPLHAHASTALLVFDELAGATGALPRLVGTQPATIELLDAASLRVAQADPRAGELLRTLQVRDHAALLLEYQEPSAESLAESLARHGPVLDGIQPGAAAGLTSDAAARADLWHIRKGLYATVAGARPTGTIALLEDVVVPVPELLPTCAALTSLFGRYGYDEAVIFGHAKDGNVHFMLTDRFDDPERLERYRHFTDEMVDLVLDAGGSLKAEHGTGRNMSAYVERQYGSELYAVMRELKALCDPGRVLAPGVILDDDPQAHLRHLKVTPQVEPEVDRCVECGYCEPVCPSKDLTTTPRQRIVLRREMAHAERRGDTALVNELREDYDYDAVQTCAVDGMCQVACPVSINTGDLTKRLRAQGHGAATERVGALAARHWGGTTKVAAALLDVARRMPPVLPTAATAAARRVLGHEAVPAWSRDLPAGGEGRGDAARTGGEARGGDAAPRDALGDAGPAPTAAVYFPSCTGSLFGPAPDGAGVGPAFVELCRRAGVSVAPVPGAARLCCGTPWRSKGLPRGYDAMREQTLDALEEATGHGALPVVCDASSCTEGLVQLLESAADDPRHGPLRVIDTVEFAATELLPRLSITQRVPSVALHPTCSSTRLGFNDALTRVGAAVAERVVVPQAWGCCAFAGDRGLLHPELTAAATAAEARELAGLDVAAHASCNRTCEMGMTRATGHDYRHVLELLEEASRPVPPVSRATGSDAPAVR